MNKYGLIGHKLSHSYSPLIHQYLFEKNNISATYSLIEVGKNELINCINDLKNNVYAGYNVTIPYKEKIIPYCDILTNAAKEIGAVNTVYISNGMVVGDNTDHSGFAKQLEFYNIEVNKKDVYILGNGGAAKAIKYALENKGANVYVVSRSGNYLTYDDLKNINKYDILINTTPLGMYPNVDSCVLDEAYIKRASICIDLIYNPRMTRFLSFANEGYHSLLMLIFQAICAEEIWHQKKFEYDLEELEKII